MYEELYEPLPDRGLYWDKLGVPEPGPDDPCDKDLLNRIIYAHQCRIPFEDLDVYELRLNVQLGIRDLFDKIIRGQRGGYCFELNALAQALLEEMGYDVMACVARGLKNVGRPITHRAMIVTIDGVRLLCDVGYGGPMPPCAIPLVDGCEVSSHGQTFKIEHMGGEAGGSCSTWAEPRLWRQRALRAILLANQRLRSPFSPSRWSASTSFPCLTTARRIRALRSPLRAW